MQGRQPRRGLLAGGEGALAQHVLLHDRGSVRLGRSISRNRCQQGLQLLEHQGFAGVWAALGHPEAQRRQVALGVYSLRGLGTGAAGGHAGEGLGCPRMALVEAAPRVGAHAAQQRSCSSLAPGIDWRSLAFDGITASAITMRWMHSYGLDLTNWAPSEASPAGSSSGTTRRPHWRRGHWHTVLHGEQRQSRRMQWFQPVYVGLS